MSQIPIEPARVYLENLIASLVGDQEPLMVQLEFLSMIRKVIDIVEVEACMAQLRGILDKALPLIESGLPNPHFHAMKSQMDELEKRCSPLFSTTGNAASDGAR